MREFFDGHVHIDWDTSLEDTIKGFDQISQICGIEKRVFMSIPHIESKQIDYLENARCLFFKKYYSPNAYAYYGLEHKEGLSESELKKDFLEQVKLALSSGFDGVKLLEGKPNVRQMFEYKLSDDVYDDMFTYLEQNGVPITMHNADPIEFWDKSKMSDYAIKHGWGAGEMTKLQMHEDIALLMKKHPNLKLSLAHFGFYADERELGEEFLSYPNTMIDITPGVKQYVIMSQDPEHYKKFFEKYQDRFKFGTDNCNISFDFEDGWYRTVTMQQTLMRNFFETDWPHKTYIPEVDKDFYVGLKLDDKILDKIYYKNIENELKEPKKIDENYLKAKVQKAIDNPLSEKKQTIAKDILNKLEKNN